MAKTLDVYREWLQIKETARPLDHYQILKLKQFEDDLAKIREHYRKLNAHVRKFSSGEFAKESQELLNELAKAMLCLTDASRKRDYDASLGRKVSGDDRRPSMEELLLASKAVDADQMAKARNFSKAVGVEIRDALLQQKLVKADLVMPAYAESIGLPFLDLNDFAIDESLVRRVPATIARNHSCVPVLIDANQLLMASPNPIDPHVEEELRLRFSMPVRSVLCLPASVNELINKHYSRETIEAEKAAGVPMPSGGSAGAAVAKAAPAPDTPEAAKQRKMIALMSFNFSFVFYQLVMAVLGRSGWGIFFLGFPLAAVVGGSVWMYVNSHRK
jgi:hypothetical protein